MILTRREALIALAAAAQTHAGRGAVAFHYEAVFPPDAVEWYTRFDTIVTGAVLPASQASVLRKNKSRLIAYEWSSGFYPGDSVSAELSWQELVRKNAKGWLLSPDPLGGAAAAPGKTALWYDFGSAEMIAARAERLAASIRASGYDGLFFDTPGFEQLPGEMQSAWKRRHPKEDYNHRQGEFFGTIKKRLGANGIVFLNQGYRHADAMLPYADMDLTESYFTAIQGAGTRFRNWHDPAAPWEAVRTPIEQLVLPSARKFPHVRFVHVNYSAGGAAVARRAARYSWACAKVYGHDSYLIAPGAYANERDDIYFNVTGKPEEPYKEEAGVVWRRYDRGVAAVNFNRGAAQIAGLGLSMPEGQQGYWFPAR